jgi:replicative DNA helicase
VDGKPLSSSWGIGETHKLVIPYTASGRTIGIAARALGEARPKYLYPSGEGWRRPELFNLNAVKGAKDLVIMEGFLDALAASVIAGIPDVVALGDSSGFNRERIEEAKRWGAQKTTLCLDNDEGGRGGTERALQTLKEHAPDLPVYVVTLPEEIKDPDELIKKEGPDALKKAIKEAVHYWEYLAEKVLKEHAPEPGEQETAKEADEIVEALERIAADITSPAERDTAYNLFTEALSPYGITKESFKKAAEAIREKGRLEKQDRALKALLKDAGKLQDEGKEKEALDLLQTRSRELKAGGADYSGLLIPVKESEIQESIRRQPESLESGYKIGGDELLFPAGALSILAGPTSHGKTALLLNVLLNASGAYTKENFHLFSYEESREAVLIRALNNYAAMELSDNNRRTIRSHYRGGNFFKKESDKAGFLDKKSAFFRDLIEPGRVNIHYADYRAPELIDAIRYLKEHGGAGAVFIDYMQLLKKPGAGYSRQEELKEICLDLKDIAVETGLPIILAAQFNREVTSPLKLFLQNIGEAGDIERAANFVLGIWSGNIRPEADKREEEAIKKLGFDSETLLQKGKLYVQILKNRDGEAGKTGWLNFNGNTGKIINSEAPESF